MTAGFKQLLAARFLFTAAVQMQAIMLGWHMYDLTHSPLHLGFIGLTEAIPALSLALYGGYLVDHHHPLKVYVRVIDASLVSGMVFVVSQVPSLGLDISMQVSALYVASFITGLARAFSQPSIYATVPKLVPRALLPTASAWTASSMQVARIGGPALGGLLFGLIGVVPSASIVCVLLVAAAAVVRRIPLFVVSPLETAQKSILHELFAGVRFVFSHPILLPALTLDMISVLFGGVTALLPVFASEILHTGPQGLGMLRAAPAVGAAITSAFLVRHEFGSRAGPLLFMAVSGFGVCILVFGLSSNFMLSLIALGLSGGFDSISMVIRGTAVQLESPEALRGRVSAVNAIFIGSSNELGEFESGVAAWALGTVPSVLFGGAVCLLTVLMVGIMAPDLRTMRFASK